MYPSYFDALIKTCHLQDLIDNHHILQFLHVNISWCAFRSNGFSI